MCNKSLLFRPSRGLSNASITPAAYTNSLSKVSSINISLRKLISVINTSCSGGGWNSATTPVTGQNDTCQLIKKGTNYSNRALVCQLIVTYKDFALLHALIIITSTKHPQECTWQCRSGIVFVVTTYGVWSRYLQGLWRCRMKTRVYTCASVTFPFCCKKTLMLLSPDSRVKRMNPDRKRHETKTLLCISECSTQHISLVTDNEMGSTGLLQECRMIWLN